jgi:hypothetical protein
MRREAAYQANGSECAGAFGERGLRNLWRDWGGASVLSGRHDLLERGTGVEPV